MTTVIIAALAGISSLVIFRKLACFFINQDKESGLPVPGMSWQILICSLVVSGYLSGINPAIAVLYFVYLVFSAYTDHYTKYLYSVVSYTYMILGIILILTDSRQDCWITIFAAWLIHAAMIKTFQLTGAISSGDVDLLITVSVWMTWLMKLNRSPSPYIIIPTLLILLGVFVIGSVCMLLLNLKRYFQKKEKRVAFAPYVLMSSSFMVLCHYFIN